LTKIDVRVIYQSVYYYFLKYLRLWDVGKSEPIKIGKASPTEGALPAALYFALKYKGNIEEALIANANVGGDSAARGIVIGMLLGSLPSMSLPEHHRWMRGLNSLPKVQQLMDILASWNESSGDHEL
jgi:ADP-ribosylglycohydrolase